MDNNQIFLQTKFINLELSNTSLNDLFKYNKNFINIKKLVLDNMFHQY